MTAQRHRLHDGATALDGMVVTIVSAREIEGPDGIPEGVERVTESALLIIPSQLRPEGDEDDEG